MAVSYVTTAASAAASSRNLSVTFTGYTPQADDLVILVGTNGSTGGAVTQPDATWQPVLSTPGVQTTDSHASTIWYHVVTAAEATAVQTSYTATNVWNAAVTGNTVGAVFRGVDPEYPIVNSLSQIDSANSVTPHVMPGLSSGNNYDGMVIGCVLKDGNAGTYTDPSGWTGRITNNATTTTWIGTRNTTHTAGSSIAATNITPNSGDEYIGYTILLRDSATIESGRPLYDSTGVSTSGTSAPSWTHTTVAASSDLYVWLAGHNSTNAGGSASYTASVTCDGSAMSSLGKVQLGTATEGQNDGYLELFVMHNLSSGAHSIVSSVTVPASSTQVGFSAAIKNSDPPVASAYSASSGTTASLSIASATGDSNLGRKFLGGFFNLSTAFSINTTAANQRLQGTSGSGHRWLIGDKPSAATNVSTSLFTIATSPTMGAGIGVLLPPASAPSIPTHLFFQAYDF